MISNSHHELSLYAFQIWLGLHEIHHFLEVNVESKMIVVLVNNEISLKAYLIINFHYGKKGITMKIAETANKIKFVTGSFFSVFMEDSHCEFDR